MDELRFRHHQQQQPLNDALMGSFVSPPRNGGSRLPQPTAPLDSRSVLSRRFTAESGRVPTLSSTAPQRAPEQQDLSAATALQKVQLLEKKRLEYEKLREQKRRFEAEMQKLDQQQRREEQELVAMQEDLGRIGVAAASAASMGPSMVGNALASGHQSEPTTPPEYRESVAGFPSIFSRPNRYSTSSLTSPPGLLFNRPGRSSSQIASPQSGILQQQSASTSASGSGSGTSSAQHQAFDDSTPSRSVPATRRNSDDDDKVEAVRQDPTSHRSTNALNRYSMPVTRSKKSIYDFMSLDQTNTTRFLFGEDDDQRSANTMSSVPDDSFPTLPRQEGQAQIMPASSAALDLMLPQSTATDTVTTNGWGGGRHHRGQPSLSGMPPGPINSSPTTQNGSASDNGSVSVVPSRRSFDMKYFSDSTSDMAVTSHISSPNNQIMVTPPKLQSSYSANDISTIKTTPASAVSSSTNNHAQQYLHNHNASLGRIPAGAIPNRHSRELSTNDISNAMAREFASIGSALHAAAAPFGGSGAAPQPSGMPHSQPTISANTLAAAAAAAASAGAGSSLPPMMTGNHFMPGYYGGPNSYNMPPPSVTPSGPLMPYAPSDMPILAQGMQALSLNSHGPGPVYTNPAYNGYASLYGGATATQIRDSQARVIQSRRQLDSDTMNRYNNTPLEAVVGTIYEMCKDQHGCRYLQKQLENRIPEQVHMIWLETNQHVVELMTDPFGNYLCQKLLEYCNDDERTALIQNAAQDMVRIALNQHGTRALQKMIEFISTDAQVKIIIEALRNRVVELIQDLNGNHVIQKCLNKLSPTNAQFIFDAVGNECIKVGTHRHGCCVLQRCIDHASGDQKTWLIQRITEEAVTLIQDPFGNYVVQYIIDLNDRNYTEPLVAQLRGRICALSRHKFSSNVVEKCLRCSLEPSRDMIVEELLAHGEIERLLRDSFANYVVQTALDYATPYMKIRLVEAIRPFLPQIRSTPYGRRIQAKVQAFESRSAQSSGHITPADSTQGQIPLHGSHSRGGSATMLLPTSAFSPNGVNGMIQHAVAGQVATAGAPNNRPVASQFANYPRTAMQPNGLPAGVTLVPAMVPVSMASNMTNGVPGGMIGPGVGLPAENGETSWL